MKSKVYSIENIEKVYSLSVNKFNVHIVIGDEIKLEELKEIISEEIIPKLKKKTDFDELYLGFYEDKNLIDYRVTLGYIIASPTGLFTGKEKLKRDLSNMKINWNGLEKFEKKWENKLDKVQAKIYKELQSKLDKQDKEGSLNNKKAEELEKEVAKKYNITVEELDSIVFKHTMQFF